MEKIYNEWMLELFQDILFVKNLFFLLQPDNIRLFDTFEGIVLASRATVSDKKDFGKASLTNATNDMKVV